MRHQARESCRRDSNPHLRWCKHRAFPVKRPASVIEGRIRTSKGLRPRRLNAITIRLRPERGQGAVNGVLSSVYQFQHLDHAPRRRRPRDRCRREGRTRTFKHQITVLHRPARRARCGERTTHRPHPAAVSWMALHNVQPESGPRAARCHPNTRGPRGGAIAITVRHRPAARARVDDG